MKKRMLPFLLCLALVMGLCVPGALATDITSVNISDVDHPVDGQTLDTDYTIPSGAAYVKDPDRAGIVWYDQGTSGFTTIDAYGEPSGTKLASGAKAVAGHCYIAALYLRRSGSGNVFPNKSFTVNVTDDMSKRLWGKNGWAVTSGGNATYVAGVYLYYKADTLYNGYNSIFLDLDQKFDGTLVDGGTPWTAANFTNYSYSQQANDFDLSVSWKQDGNPMSAGAKFKAGYTYAMTLTFDSGTARKHTATFGTDEWYVYINDTYHAGPNISSDYKATATFTFPCKGAVQSMDIESIKAPVAGEAPQTSGFTVGPYLATVKSAKWYTYTEVPVEVTGALRANTNYSLVLTLTPPDGLVFALTKDKISANLGTVSKYSLNADGTATVEILIPVGAAPKINVSSAAVTVTAPKLDGLPVFVATPDGAGYSVFADDGGSYIGGVCWVDDTEDPALTDNQRVLKENKTAAFLPGHTYRVSVELTAQDGYVFTDAPKGTVNGQDAKANLQGDVLTLTYTFPALPAAATQPAANAVIDKVAVMLQAPAVGAQAGFTAYVPGDANYTAESVHWFCDNDDTALKQGDSFGKKAYILNVTLAPKAGYAFADESSLTGTLNGSPAQTRRTGDKALLTQYFSLTDPLPPITRTPIPATGTAYANTQQVELNGTKITIPVYALKNEQGYDTNYIRLRDLADLLKFTAAQFDVTWAADTGIACSSHTPYAHPNGTEGNIPFSGNQPYTAMLNDTFVDSVAQPLTAFTITYQGGGHTYYQLRDLGKALGFNVGWTAVRGMFIETDKAYDAND